MLKKRHVSDCCYKKNGDFNPTYHDWLGGREKQRERERERERRERRERERREREREREVLSTTEESKVGESG